MTLVIDASNIRTGGGLTHLQQLLNKGQPNKYGFSKVIIWSSETTLAKIQERQWLVKRSHPLLNKSFIHSFFFQAFFFNFFLKKENCSILLVPGGTFLGRFKPFATISQNMLPFQMEEVLRFKDWRTRIRFIFLNFTQSYTFRRADAVIFLTKFAKCRILSETKISEAKTTIIPHGIASQFTLKPRPQRSLSNCSSKSPFKLLYVSIVTAYKHQWNVAEAVMRLRKESYDIVLDLIGPATHDYLERLNLTLAKYSDDEAKGVKYLGAINHKDLKKHYANADGFIFASSCENMPIILIEAMSAGLPIACSNKGPMPEVLGNAGWYFDPTSINSIYECLKRFLEDENKRFYAANESYSRVENYSWEKCSDNTFNFLSRIVNKADVKK